VKKAPIWVVRSEATGVRIATVRGRRVLLRQYIVQGVAGYAAERRLVQRPPPRDDSPGTDAHDAIVCARLLGFRGARVTAFISEMERDADAILDRRWREVICLAMRLETRWVLRRIGANELDAIIAEARRASPPPRSPSLGPRT
jgi:hypothetical protein